MKRLAAIWLVMLLLAGCSGGNDALDRTMQLRAKLLGSSGCGFDGVITADYGDKLVEFTLHCEADSQGNVTFSVEEPESIAGISGNLSAKGGELTFDDKALAIPMLADGQLTPISAPWVLVRALTGGYVTSCGMEGELIRANIHDSYEEDALVVDFWLKEGLPVRAEISYRDRRILTVEIEDFRIL